jgi:sarcosine oxidase subunit alpha
VTAFRLPPPAGQLIDRGRSLSFRFEGKAYEGHPGDTIASALAANGVSLLSRSFKYHRARGLLSGAGLDGNTLVQLPGAPNLPADRLALEDGLDIAGQHYRGSLAEDRDAFLEKLARFMPVGFYYRAFFRPLGIWQKFWEPLFRARAGLGRIGLETAHRHFDKQHLFCDVAVIGAGPAGLSAALAAADAGHDVLLVSDEPYLGGSLAHTRFDADRGASRQRREELIGAVRANPRITIMQDTTCTGWFADHWLSLLAKDRLYKVRAKRTVFATGVIEQPVVFRNNDLPGIMSGSAAQRFIHLYGVKPGHHTVVLAGNDHAFGVALDLAEAGIEIATIADLRPERRATPLANEAMRRSLPIQTVRRVNEAMADRSRSRVSAIVLDDIPYDCDLVCMSPGFAPAYQLPAQAGASVRYDDRQATFLVTPQAGSGVAIAGAVNGVHDLDAMIADGARAGRGDSHGWRAGQSAVADLSASEGQGLCGLRRGFAGRRYRQQRERRLSRHRTGQALFVRRHGPKPGSAVRAQRSAHCRAGERRFGRSSWRHDGAAAGLRRAARAAGGPGLPSRAPHADA